MYYSKTVGCDWFKRIGGTCTENKAAATRELYWKEEICK